MTAPANAPVPNRFGLRTNAPQLRLTAAAAVAAGLASLTLSPLFSGGAWRADALLAVVVVALVGAGGRWLRVPRPVVVVLQLAGLAALVTSRFAPENSTFGIVPSVASFRSLIDVVREGGESINQQIVPVEPVTGIVLLVTLGIGLAAVEIDLTAVACRCPAIAGIVVLAIYGVTIAVMPNGASWPWFAVSAVGWLLLLYVGRREAARDWADVIPYRGRSQVTSDPRAPLGLAIGTGAVLAGVLVAGLVPGLGDGVIGRVTDGIGGSGTGAAGGPVRLDLSATIKRNLQSSTETPLLTYRTDDSTPQYLRLTVLDRFEGVAWLPAELPVGSPSINDGEQLARGIDYTRPDVRSLNTSIATFGATRDLAYLPAPYTPVSVVGPKGQWKWDTTTSTVFSRTARLGEERYEVTSLTVPPSAQQLAEQNGAQDADAYELRVPQSLPSSIKQTATTAVAGATTDYAKAVRLQGFFRSNFTYSLDAPPTDTATAIDTFLTDKQGYCQQFAATYALMARSVGLASRVVVGFTPGTPSGDGAYTVTTKDYHAWPEVWFDDAGWVRFEPTPRADRGSRIDVPAWTLPGPFAPPSASQPSASASAAPAPAASTAPTRQPAAEGPTAAAVTTSWTDRLAPLGYVLLLIVVVLLVAAPGLVRARRRRRRLDPDTITAASIEAAWDELADTARDLGVTWNEDDTPRRTADAFVTSAGLEGRAAVAVQDLRRDVELTRYAGRAGDPDRKHPPADSVRTVRRSLLARSSRGDRLRAVVAPRTAWRRWSGKQ